MDWKSIEDKKNDFFEYIKETGLPGLKNTTGNLGVQILIKDFFAALRSPTASSNLSVLPSVDRTISLKSFTPAPTVKPIIYYIAGKWHKYFY